MNINELIGKIRTEHDAKIEFLNKHHDSIVPLLERLDVMDGILSITSDETWLSIGATGDKKVLNAVWRVLRAKGFKTTDTVPEKATYASATFYNEAGCMVFFSFSSNACKRVKTGTKMVEQDVYEIQCD